MSRTIHRPARLANDGYDRVREPKPEPRRTGTRDAAIRAEISADTDRVTPGVRKPYLSQSVTR